MRRRDAWAFALVMSACDTATGASETGDVVAAEPSACARNTLALAATLEPAERNGEHEIAGVVVSVDAHALVLATDGGEVTLRYALGGHSVPVVPGEPVVLVWLALDAVGVESLGFAILTPGGEPLAIMDRGWVSSAWNHWRHPLPIPGGFFFLHAPAGCLEQAERCGFRTPTGLRVSREIGQRGTQVVVTLPGGEAVLTTPEGRRYRVIDAGSSTFRLTEPCAHVSGGRSWLILAQRAP